MLVKTYGSAVYGIKATTITIEVNVSQGINFILVGLPDVAVKESQQVGERGSLRLQGTAIGGKCFKTANFLGQGGLVLLQNILGTPGLFERLSEVLNSPPARKISHAHSHGGSSTQRRRDR